MVCDECCLTSFSAELPFQQSPPGGHTPAWDTRPASRPAPRTIYVDVIETDDEIEILADIPGLHKEDIIVDIDRNTVTLDVTPCPTTTSHSRSSPPDSPSAELRLDRATAALSDIDLSDTDVDVDCGSPWSNAAAPLASPATGTPERRPARSHSESQSAGCCKVHYSERCSGLSRRSLVLPDSADLRRASASYQAGVLRLLIPTLAAEASRRKRLRVV